MTKTMHVIPSKGEKVVELTRRNTEEWEKKEAGNSKSSSRQ
jgi:hypothetical protein